jgi:hypothetical protein
MGSFATAINCMDGRVQVPVIDYIKERFGVDHVDMITLPGPDKALAENEESAAIDSIRASVAISVEKHGSKTVAICGHYDCAGNPSDRDTQKKEIAASVEVVRSWGLGVDVIGLWVNQEWQVEKIV